MVFGHNTNLKIGGTIYHVQTEDRGPSHALIDTTVYLRGRVLHRRTNNYFDLLPLNEDTEQALKLRLEDQHSTVIEEIRSGAIQLVVPPPVAGAQGTAAAPVTPAAVQPAAQAPEQAPEGKLVLELTNSKSWLSGKNARLQLVVREESGESVCGAKVRVEIEGSAQTVPLEKETGSQGEAEVEFEMPKLTGAQAALVIHAENGMRTGQLRFALRAKPRVA